ncbi:hypothetical protein BDP27DRAFT_1425538 [Rhodocollybia butyracea]|uniref:Peptidase A2 domain-containing protein n=1 Tax=Rhodocollybia butyracea TaxID=206335 RepID=A0A9P5U3N0_9AGAR|nr:hypothetical protein BDP27DRAFT_1425538 [Rhodocollybia butyracea]
MSWGIREEGAITAHSLISREVLYAEEGAYPAHSVSKKKGLTLEGALYAHELVPGRVSNTLTNRRMGQISEGAFPAHDSIRGRDGAIQAHLTGYNNNDFPVDEVKGSTSEGAFPAHNSIHGREGATPAHLSVPRYNLENRNTRQYIKHEGKGKEVEKDPSMSRIVSHKSSCELPYPCTHSPIPIPDDHFTIERVPKARSLPEGMHSLGTQALHIKARVNLVYKEPIEARLDSGADISLILEEYWRLVPELGPIKQGLRMTLYHLTGEAKVMGYVGFPMFVESTDSTMIQFDTEAYVI